jgi:hypothetical protein
MLKLPTFELCGILKSGSSLPLISNYILNLKTRFPTLPFSCSIPIPYHFEARNVTIQNDDESGIPSMAGKFPNGKYRSILKFSNSNDTEGVTYEWMDEKNDRLNDDFF